MYYDVYVYMHGHSRQNCVRIGVRFPKFNTFSIFEELNIDSVIAGSGLFKLSYPSLPVSSLDPLNNLETSLEYRYD